MIPAALKTNKVLTSTSGSSHCDIHEMYLNKQATMLLLKK
jgi:hypothetical protein